MQKLDTTRWQWPLLLIQPQYWQKAPITYLDALKRILNEFQSFSLSPEGDWVASDVHAGYPFLC